MTVSFGITVETITKLSYKFQQKKYIYINHTPHQSFSIKHRENQL